MKRLTLEERTILKEAAQIRNEMRSSMNPLIQKIIDRTVYPVMGKGRDLWQAELDGLSPIHILADSKEEALKIAKKHYLVGTDDLWKPKIGLFLKARG
jgi:hypothetical protein